MKYQYSFHTNYLYKRSIFSPAAYDENFDQLSMNIIIEAAKFEPEPTFENTINEIKVNNLNGITSIETNLSDIPSNKSS